MFVVKLTIYILFTTKGWQTAYIREKIEKCFFVIFPNTIQDE